MPLYEFECDECGAVFEVFQGMNDEHRAYHCGKEAARKYSLFETPADLMYQFRDEIGGKFVDINSKKQYEKLLKENGLRAVTMKEHKANNEYFRRKRNVRSDFRPAAKRIADKIYKMGAMNYVMGKT